MRIKNARPRRHFTAVAPTLFYRGRNSSRASGKRRASSSNVSSAKRLKFAASRTRTLVKRVKTKVVNGSGLTGQQSFSRHSFYHGGKLNQRTQKLGGPLTSVTNQCINQQWSAGTQTFMDASCVNDAHLKFFCDEARGDLAYVNNPSTTVNTALGGSKVYVKHAIVEIFYTNNTVRPVFLELYDYRVRRDCAQGFIGLLGSIDNPNPPPATSGFSTINPVSLSTPFVQPTDTSEPLPFYCITKRTRVWLAPGETHIHKIFTKYNKVYDNQLFTTSPATNLKGWTFGCLARMLSTCVRGSTSGADLGDGEITMYVNQRLIGRAIVQTVQATSGQKIIAPVVGNQQFVSEVIGQVFQQNVGTNFADLG